MCQFVAHIYRCIPVSTGRTVPLTQSRIKDEINESLVSFIGTEQEQQVILSAFAIRDIHIQISYQKVKWLPPKDRIKPTQKIMAK